MTAIVAIVHEGRVWMGGDSVWIGDDESVGVSRSPKVIRTGHGWLVGFSGCWPVQNRITGADWPDVPVSAEQLGACVEVELLDMAKGWDTELADAGGWDLLIGARGRIWMLDMGQVPTALELTDEGAIGSGGAFALGSLHTTRGRRMSPRKRIEAALSAAAAHAIVRPPWTILTERSTRDASR